MKILVCGTRSWNDYKTFSRKLTHLTKNLKNKITLVVGDCPTGADRMLDQWMHENWKQVKELKRFRADWSIGKSAGPKRNGEMIKFMNGKGIVIAYWDGKSKGTKDCIDQARRVKLKVKVIEI